MKQPREKKPPVNIKDLDPSKVRPQAEKGPLTYLGSKGGDGRNKPGVSTPLLVSMGSLALVILLGFVILSWASSKREVGLLEAKVVELQTLKSVVEQERARLESVVNTMGNYVKRDELPKSSGR